MIQVGLHSGGILRIDPIDVSEVQITDIAYGLSFVSRFGGQAGQYSVAEHSVYLDEYYSRTVSSPSPNTRRAMLIHDAGESLGVGDVNRFIKRRYAQALRDFDDELSAALWSKFGHGEWRDLHAVIAPLDEQLGLLEAEYFGFPHDSDRLRYEYTVYPRYWTPDVAYSKWMTSWESCT